MWLYLRNIVLGLLLITVLLASLGISYSKISCSEGQQLVLGSETPQCNKDIKQCCHNKEGDSNNQSKEKDNRKKETFHFKIDFVTCHVENLELNIISPFISPAKRVEKQYLDYSPEVHYIHFKCNPPPLLTKPTNSFLQTFLI